MSREIHLPPRLKDLWADEKRRADLLLILGAAGMLLLAVSEWLPAKTDAPPAVETTAQAEPVPDYAAELEQRLQALLAQVEGTGRVEVMVTLQAGAETVYAQNTDTAADGSTRREPVLVSGSGGPALVERVAVPAVQGVAVVCEGGGSAAVQSRVTAIVAALTGAGSSHITVTPMVTAQTREG